MTAQAGERLFYQGAEACMAVEPLSQYLQSRNDIRFFSPSTACWRGYYGKWEIKNSKLYLIELEAYIEGYRKVGLDYLFPGQNTVFADWFSGTIRIPQGKILDYVHMGYNSLYEMDLILVFEDGLMTNKSLVDNEEEYHNRIEQREKMKIELIESASKRKKKDKITKAIGVVLFSLAFIGLCIVVYNIVQQRTTLSYVFSAIIIVPQLVIIGCVIFLIAKELKNRLNEDEAIAFAGIIFLILVFNGICIGLYYLIKCGTMLAYFISGIVIISLLYLVFFVVKNHIKRKN